MDCTFQATCNKYCTIATETKSIPILEVKLKSINFAGSNNYTLAKQGNDSFTNDKYGDDGNVTIDTEWIDNDLDGSPETDDPACYKINSTPTMNFTLNNGCTLTSNVSAILRVKSGPETICNPKVITLSGTESSDSITWQSLYTTLISNSYFELNWEISFDGGSSYSSIGSSENIILVVLDSPTGHPTVTAKRVDWATGKASGTSDPSDAVDGIHDGLGGVDPPYEPNEKPTLGSGWELLDGEKYGECDEQAQLMAFACEILGISASLDLVYPSTNTDCNTQETRTCTNHGSEELSGYTGFWNNFEGVCKTEGKYYAVWPKFSEDTKVEVLRTWLSPSGYYQAWWSPTHGVCNNPGPNPVPLP